jgi:hypothetical protein
MNINNYRPVAVYKWQNIVCLIHVSYDCQVRVQL